MKLFGPFTLLASFITLLSMAHALVISTWSVTNGPSAGLTDISFPLTIVEADHIPGYYFAQRFQFRGPRRRRLHRDPAPSRQQREDRYGVFSSFAAGTTTSDKNCQPHTGAEVGTEDHVWVGTVVDTVTGARIQIGSYTLPAGSEGIKSSQVGFVEWYPWNRSGLANHCARLPYRKTIFGNPCSTQAGSVGMHSLLYEYGDCIEKVAFHTEKLAGGV